MYKPAPPRPKKTGIVRNRTGCQNCRTRRKKCDEKKPACSGCTRLGKHCDGYATKLEFRGVSFRLNEPRSDRSQGFENPILYQQETTCGPINNTPQSTCIHYNNSPRLTLAVDSDLAHTPTFSQTTTIKPSRESFYMNIWENQCAPALHPIFHRLVRLQSPSLVVVDTTIALAARQLSRMLPRSRKSNSLDVLGSSFRPDLEQLNISGEFSSSAMRTVARWTKPDFEQNPTAALTVLILFCYLESLMSNFQGFYLHSAAVEMLISTQGVGQSQLDDHVADLFTAWTQSKLHNWWRRFHFSTPNFQRNHPSLITNPIPLPLNNSSRVLILMILCESYRLNAAILIHYYDTAIGSMPTGLCDVEIPPNELQPPPSSFSSMVLGGEEEQLNYQRGILNSWYTQLPPSELPIDSYSITPISFECESPSLQVKPLRFSSHEAAMNFAYYVTAKVMQCTEFVRSFQQENNRAEVNDACNTAEPWILLLLRIATGINWESCVRYNAFTIGLSGLLLACVLRSENLAIGLWVEDWLEKRYHEGCLEEGSFPIFQILQVLYIINQERRSRRHVYAICQPTDDGGGGGKFDSYNSQRLVSLLVYGWCSDSRCLYSRRIVLGA